MDLVLWLQLITPDPVTEEPSLLRVKKRPQVTWKDISEEEVGHLDAVR